METSCQIGNVIIPARKGSTRLRGKNKAIIWGKPSIEWVINSCFAARMVNRVIVASDDEDILKIAQDCGAEIYVRTKDIDNNTSKLIACRHILEHSSDTELLNSPLALVQANSPDISPGDIDTAILACQEGDRLESISMDTNFNQIGAIRAFWRPSHLWTAHLSYKAKFFEVTCSDIHTQEDLDALEKRGLPSYLRGATPPTSG